MRVSLAPPMHGLRSLHTNTSHSMDKLFDLMVMGAKYQLLACATHEEMIQVGACKPSAAASSPRHAAACHKPHTRMHSRLHFLHQCKAPT